MPMDLPSHNIAAGLTVVHVPVGRRLTRPTARGGVAGVRAWRGSLQRGQVGVEGQVEGAVVGLQGSGVKVDGRLRA